MGFGLTWDAGAHMECGQRVFKHYRSWFSDLSFLEMGNISDKGPLFVADKWLGSNWCSDVLGCLFNKNCVDHLPLKPLSSVRKPRPLGGVRVIWLCLENSLLLVLGLALGY